MAEITNKYGLPESIVRAVRYSDYDAGDSDITVTQLVSPPQLVELRRLHDAEIVEDASDRIWMLMGSIAHGILQRADIQDALTEERLYTEVNGWKVSGSFDRTILLPDETVQDFKVTSVYAAKDAVKAEWEAQLNCYAHLLRLHSFAPRKLEIVAILRDWRPSEAKRNPQWYPPVPVKVMPVNLWNGDYTDGYLSQRVTLHQAARNGQYQPCTPPERWEQPSKIAVYRNDNKTATKLCATQEEAETVAAEIDAKPRSKARIEVRPAIQMRCQSYCPVSQWCETWAKLKPTVVEEITEEA